MSRRQEERVEELKTHLRKGEKTECIPEISGAPRLILFIAAAVISFAVGRVFPGKMAVLMLTNIISMWMMVDAARVLADTQDACLLVTNQRVFGKAGKDVNLYYRDIISVENTPNGLFIKADKDHRSVMIRNLRNKEEVYRTIKKHIG